MVHQSFITTTTGLRRDTPPMTLFEKAKRLGVWNPSDIDFSKDREDWKQLSRDEQSLLLHLTSMFQAGEEAVTLDLLPLIQVIAKEGRVEEELFLTTFLWEEAKHTDFFHRFLEEVVEGATDLNRFHGPHYRHLFYEILPKTLGALTTDHSGTAQAKASATYNMVIEGMLAETGYHAYFSVLDEHGILPGQRHGVSLLKQDEARHIAYGIYLLSRLISDDAGLWYVVESTMTELLTPALGTISESLGCYDPIPFGLKESDFTDFAMSQFQKRLERIQRARDLTFDEIIHVTHQIIEEDDA